MNDPTRQNRNIRSLKVLAQKAAQLFFDECKRRGINVFATEYHRSQERQDYLYAQGRTRPGNIVTWTRNSNHTSGYAWDIACSPPHDLYDRNILMKAGEVARELGIEWGGDWKQKDTPHFQISPDWKNPLDEYIQSVFILNDAGIIGNLTAWQEQNINLNNVPSLIIKASRELFGTKDFNCSVIALRDYKIIGNIELWLAKEYNKEHVKSLIIKIARHIEG